MKKIVIIEDDEFLGSVMEEKLKLEGFNAIWAKDGALGLKKISDEMPDLVLLDMMLPTLSGYEILEAKQKLLAIKDIPVIVISNSGQPVELDRILALGVKDYLIKVQFSPKEVIDKVRKLLGVATPEAASEGQKLKGKVVMMVEDDEFLGDLLARKLVKEGAELVHALNGADAFSRLEQKIPDVMTLDMILPGMSGYEILEKLKADPKYAQIPVLMLTNLSQKEDIEKTQKLGVKEFLVKSLYTLDEIIEKIAGAITK